MVKKILNRDQRLIIRTHREIGASYSAIQKATGFPISQIRYACRNNVDLTPQKRKTGRHHTLSSETVTNTIQWIQQSPQRRNLTYNEIYEKLQLPVCGETLRLELKRRGMVAHSATQKSPNTTASTTIAYQDVRGNSSQVPGDSKKTG
jgi:hypothetical protein